MGVDCFEELRIWQQARELVKNIYQDFGQETLGTRDWGFRDQIQRASVSIMNNIAEGFERNSDADFARFLDIAKGSCGEVGAWFIPQQICVTSPENGQTSDAVNASKYQKASVPCSNISEN